MMMRTVVRVFGMLAVLGVSNVYAQSAGTPVFNNLPEVVPGNVTSLGFQATATSEFGDHIELEADTPRRVGSATVLMSSWSLHANYPALPAGGYAHPITLNIYADAAAALAHVPVASVTQVFTIPWRPAADPSCGGTKWRSVDGNCYNGVAFQLVFDLRSMNYDLPSQFIYGIAYNTNTWGYQPINSPGPYESLNVGFTGVSAPSVGADVDADIVYWNTAHAGFYTDGGPGGTFRADTGWTGLPIGAKFTTFAVPAQAADCKNGAWQNLVRADFSAFKNKGECVSYTNVQN